MKSMAHVDGIYWWHIHVVSLIDLTMNIDKSIQIVTCWWHKVLPFMKSMAHVDGTYWWHIHVVSRINRHYDEYRQSIQIVTYWWQSITNLWNVWRLYSGQTTCNSNSGRRSDTIVLIYLHRSTTAHKRVPTVIHRDSSSKNFDWFLSHL